MDAFYHNVSQMFGGISAEFITGTIIVLVLAAWYIWDQLGEMETKTVRRIFAVMLALLIATFGCAYNQYVLRMDAIHKADTLQQKLVKKDMPDTGPIIPPSRFKKSDNSTDRDNSSTDSTSTRTKDNIPTAPDVQAPNISTPSTDDEYVAPYVRSNGTVVRGHWRTHKNSTPTDNYSYEGNVNPYTGKVGHHKY